MQSDSSEDLFVHYSKINMSGYKVLKEGQRVQFEITQRKKADKLAISQLFKATVLGC
ncbi:cold shock domain-containing protein [Acinetobacter sp. YH12068_T]|nr:cold shock domain-containing protein [Acinetobacter sp. YH12068_T]